MLSRFPEEKEDGPCFEIPAHGGSLTVGRTVDARFGIPAMDNVISRKQFCLRHNKPGNAALIQSLGASPTFICARIQGKVGVEGGHGGLNVVRRLEQGDVCPIDNGAIIALLSPRAPKTGMQISIPTPSTAGRPTRFKMFDRWYGFHVLSADRRPAAKKRRRLPPADPLAGPSERVTRRPRTDASDDGNSGSTKRDDGNSGSAKRDIPPPLFRAWLESPKYGWGSRRIDARSSSTQSWAYMPIIASAVHISAPGIAAQIPDDQYAFWSSMPTFHALVDQCATLLNGSSKAAAMAHNPRNWDCPDHLSPLIQTVLGGLGTPPLGQAIQYFAARILKWAHNAKSSCAPPSPSPRPPPLSAPPRPVRAPPALDGKAQSWEYRPPEVRAGRPRGDWRNALYGYVEDPEAHAAHVLYADGDVVAVYDAYPKARVHILVIPRRRRITGPTALKPADAPLVQVMIDRAKWLAARVREHNPQHLRQGAQFRIGFHAIPSLKPLHLHVISDDFESPCVKTKKHWNSFTTDFFVRAEAVVAALRQGTQFTVDTARFRALLKAPLQCHRCGQGLRNIPLLKRHIVRCTSDTGKE